MNVNNISVPLMFQCIGSIQDPVRPVHMDCNRSFHDATVEWSKGDVAAISLDVVAVDDCVTCAPCAKENSLLDTPQ